MTSARCCLAADEGVSPHGIHVTIGAVQVESTDVITEFANGPNVNTYYEFVRMDSGRIHIPPRYRPDRLRDPPGPIWDICIIKLQQMYRVHYDYVDIGKASVGFSLKLSLIFRSIAK